MEWRALSIKTRESLRYSGHECVFTYQIRTAVRNWKPWFSYSSMVCERFDGFRCLRLLICRETFDSMYHCTLPLQKNVANNSKQQIWNGQTIPTTRLCPEIHELSIGNSHLCNWWQIHQCFVGAFLLVDERIIVLRLSSLSSSSSMFGNLVRDRQVSFSILLLSSR